MLLMHGLSYGPALARNTKERASVYQSDKLGLKPTRVTSHTIPPPKVFNSSMSLQHVFYSELSCRNWKYHQLHPVNRPRNFLHLLAERDYNCTLGSVKMKQLTSQEKTLSQPLGNIFSRSCLRVPYTQYGFLARVACFWSCSCSQKNEIIVRLTLMGTKNLNENGPNHFFYSGPKIWSESILWQWFCFGMFSTIINSISLFMRGRYYNEIAEWKWPPIFQNKSVRYARADELEL